MLKPLYPEIRVPGSGPLLAIFTTSHGEITVELDEPSAPKSVRTFIGLALGTQPFRDARLQRVVEGGESFYQDTTFHRVVPDFMIQGGDRLGTGFGGPGFRIVDELTGRHDERGVLSFAHSGPTTTASQFFLTVRAAPWLDGVHTVLGTIVHGHAVVRDISHVPTDERDRPRRPVKLRSIQIRHATP